MFLRFKPFILLLKSILHLLFNDLLSGNRFLLHSPLHLVELALKVFFFLHDLIIMTSVTDPLVMIELTFHVIGEKLHSLLIFKSQLLLQ